MASREEILNASVSLVAERGVRGLSFREVARRAGVSHQAPYHHFGNQDGLLRAIARDGFARLAASMSIAAAAHDHPAEALTAGGVAYVAFARGHVGHFRVMFDAALVALDDPDDPVDTARQTHGVLQRLAREAHATGHGAHLDVDVLATLCWSTVHGLAVLLVEGILAAKGPMDDASERALTEAVVRGLGGLLARSASRG